MGIEITNILGYNMCTPLIGVVAELFLKHSHAGHLANELAIEGGNLRAAGKDEVVLSRVGKGIVAVDNRQSIGNDDHLKELAGEFGRLTDNIVRDNHDRFLQTDMELSIDLGEGKHDSTMVRAEVQSYLWAFQLLGVSVSNQSVV